MKREKSLADFLIATGHSTRIVDEPSFRNFCHTLDPKNTLSENTNAMEYWLSKCDQYKNISNLALDLISAPASQAYVERVFSVCGDLSARKRNRATVGLERRVFLKLNKR